MAFAGLHFYFENENTLSSNMVIIHEKTKPKYSIGKIAKNAGKELKDEFHTKARQINKKRNKIKT